MADYTKGDHDCGQEQENFCSVCTLKLHDQIDTLTCALAEAMESHKELLESSRPYQPGVMTNCSLPDNLRQQDRFKKAIASSKEILSNPTSQRASEEMKTLRQMVKDYEEDEDKIIELACKVLPEKHVRGDSNGVPTNVDLVEWMTEEMKGLRKVLFMANKMRRSQWAEGTYQDEPAYLVPVSDFSDLKNTAHALEACESRGKA